MSEGTIGTAGAEMTAAAQTGVETQPAAGGAEQATVQQTETTAKTAPEGQEQKPTGEEATEKAFAARLRQARESWERENGPYLNNARELERIGIDVQEVLRQARQQDVNTLVQQGYDPQVAQEIVAERQRAARAEQMAADARLEAEAAKLAQKYGKDFDPDAVVSFARQRAAETGESLTLETAFALMNHTNVRRQTEQQILASLRAGQEKGTEAGTKGAGAKTVAEMTDADIAAMSERVRRGEKIVI